MSSRTEDAALRRLIEDYRSRCLWFLGEDYYPETPEERERELTVIERHGDHAAFQRVAEVWQWLSRPSTATSAGS